MDDFGDNFVQPDVDPAADFLAREQDQLAGLEDELETGAPPPFSAATNGLSEFNDFSNTHSSTDELVAGVENPMPDVDNVTSNGLLGMEQPDYFGSNNESEQNVAPMRQEREEPEKIKIWREEQKKRLEEKDAEEEKRKQEMLKVAKKELEDWYKAHEEQIAKTKAANREAAKNAERALARGSEEASPEGGEWARVAELCDFGPRRGKDVARLRSLVLQLKQSGVRPKYPPRPTKVA